MPLKVSDEDFITAWKRLGSPDKVAKELKLELRGVYRRRTAIEQRYSIQLDTTAPAVTRQRVEVAKQGFRALQENVTGTVIVGSDGHFWPGERSKAFAAFVELVKELNPSMVVMAGDSFDGARVSRHPPGGWADLPDVASELEAVKERHAEIEAHAPAGIPLIWTLGNHCSRFTSRLAQQAPEYMNVQGMDITDHFPAWNFCWSIFLNNTTVIKHRWHQGQHGAFQNTVKSGKNIITGHTHRLQSTMWADYNGLRWGIEAGTLSEFGPDSDKFFYGEDNPHNWSQGFVVLTFTPTGLMLEPEFCRVINGNAWFRGRVVV